MVTVDRIHVIVLKEFDISDGLWRPWACDSWILTEELELMKLHSDVHKVLRIRLKMCLYELVESFASMILMRSKDYYNFIRNMCCEKDAFSVSSKQTVIHWSLR